MFTIRLSRWLFCERLFPLSNVYPTLTSYLLHLTSHDCDSHRFALVAGFLHLLFQLLQPNPWVQHLSDLQSSQPFQYGVNKIRWKVNNISTMSTFLGKESTSSGKVVNRSQTEQSTKAVWMILKFSSVSSVSSVDSFSLSSYLHRNICCKQFLLLYI